MQLNVDGKNCPKCNTFKPFTDYYKASSKASKIQPIGMKSHCKPCVSIQRKEYYKTPDGYKKKIEKAWRDKGMIFTLEAYRDLLAKQGGGCAICGAKSNPSGKALCLDHDHKTGEIRGILCHNCNTGLGRFQDTLSVLEKAVSYLKGTQQCHLS